MNKWRLYVTNTNFGTFKLFLFRHWPNVHAKMMKHIGDRKIVSCWYNKLAEVALNPPCTWFSHTIHTNITLLWCSIHIKVARMNIKIFVTKKSHMQWDLKSDQSKSRNIWNLNVYLQISQVYWQTVNCDLFLTIWNLDASGFQIPIVGDLTTVLFAPEKADAKTTWY